MTSKALTPAEVKLDCQVIGVGYVDAESDGRRIPAILSQF